ncbi:helix-turn-helix transcriptional regulator [Gimesia aquarii]|uniref:helix-turn-helix transcriptional regulator n=1 Tax=Gimesia aquarii TaxID=2527964 RepID=UPI0018D6F5F0|nr:helix-turn-helix transcriptional regulator [Gimesia aquarii]
MLDTENQLLDQLGRNYAVVCDTRESVLKALERTDANSLWISRRSEKTVELAKTLVELISESGAQRRSSFGNLLTLESAKVDVRPILERLFGHVVGVSRQFRRLPLEELTEVLSATPEERRDVFIGGVLNSEFKTLVLVRGNLEQIIVPLSMFRPSGRATPDFTKFELGDYGHTLQFGDYEATTDIVLWEVDSDYRKRAKARERNLAKGFGPSLRRLRKQRGLSQFDFPNVSRRTISRIEKGDVDKPHEITLNRIAKALGVPAEEIESY